MAGYRQQLVEYKMGDPTEEIGKAFTSGVRKLVLLAHRRIHYYSKWRTKSIMGSRRGAANFEEGCRSRVTSQWMNLLHFGWLKMPEFRSSMVKIMTGSGQESCLSTGNEPHILIHTCAYLKFQAQRRKLYLSFRDSMVLNIKPDMVDNSQGHGIYAPDALLTRDMNFLTLQGSHQGFEMGVLSMD